MIGSVAGAVRRDSLIYAPSAVSPDEVVFGRVYENDPLGGSDMDITLPRAPAAGCTIRACCAHDFSTVHVFPDEHDTIMLDGKAAGDAIESTTGGSNVELVADGAGNWVVTSLGGTWV